MQHYWTVWNIGEKEVVPRKGFDPLISTLKGWRPNLARRPGHVWIFYYNGLMYCHRSFALGA